MIPDIDLPSLYDISEIGESSLDGALPWDHIRPAHYQTFDDFSSIIPQLQLLHEKRAHKDPDFTFLVKTNKLIEEKREVKTIALNEAKRKAETESLKKTQLEFENERRLAKKMEPLKSVDELDNGDEDEEGSKDDKPTPLLTETGYILIDYLNLKHPKIVKK